jgi:hypothetical protein
MKRRGNVQGNMQGSEVMNARGNTKGNKATNMQRSVPNNEATNMRSNKECTKQHEEATQGGNARR